MAKSKRIVPDSRRRVCAYQLHRMFTEEKVPDEQSYPYYSYMGGGVFRTPSNFPAFVEPLTVKYIEMFHADFSYLSIY